MSGEGRWEATVYFGSRNLIIFLYIMYCLWQHRQKKKSNSTVVIKGQLCELSLCPVIKIFFFLLKCHKSLVNPHGLAFLPHASSVPGQHCHYFSVSLFSSLRSHIRCFETKRIKGKLIKEQNEETSTFAPCGNVLPPALSLWLGRCSAASR